MNDQELIDKFIYTLVSKVTAKYSKEIDFIILFGSAARGEFKKGVSDIDLVIQLKEKGKHKEIESYATKVFWELDKIYKTDFAKVLSTKKTSKKDENFLKNIEKTFNFYVPIFVFPPGWLDWTNGRISRPFWKPLAVVLVHQTLIFEKFKREGKVLFGRDIRKDIKPKITFWERWKALQIPLYISFFSVIISPVLVNFSVKYSTKALLFQLDSVLDFLNIKKRKRDQKLESLKNESKSKFELEILGFYVKTTLSFIRERDLGLFDKALDIKTKKISLSGVDSYKFVYKTFWFILRLNWSVLAKRLFSVKNAGKTFITLVILSALIYFSLSYYVLFRLTHPDPKPLNFNPNDISSSYTDITFKSRHDNLNLSGWFFNSTSNKVLILVSGSDQNRIDPGYDTGNVSKDLIARGFNILIFDFRGRGNSQEAIYSIGAHEQNDIAGAVDYLNSQGFKTNNIGIVAISLGAGTSILALPSIPEIGGIVADSSYADIKTLLARELPGRSKLPAFFTYGLGFWAKIIYEIKLDDMIPVETLKNFPQKKLLFIHGTEDEDIPLQDSLDLLKVSPKSDIWLVKDAGHVKAYKTNPAEYISKISNYFYEVL